MGKRILILLAVIAVVVAALPPLFGIMYERQIRAQVEEAPDYPYLSYALDSYDRGLYSSQGSFRLAFSDEYVEQMRAVLTPPQDEPPTDEQQAIVDNLLEFVGGEVRFDITVDHGPITFSNGINAALAQVHAELDSTTGALAEFQAWVNAPYLYQVDAVVDFDGSSDFTASVPAMSVTEGDARLDFSGFDTTGRYDNRVRNVKATGKSDSLRVESQGVSITMNQLEFETDSRILEGYMWLGTSGFDVGNFAVAGPQGKSPDAISIRDFGVDVSSEMNAAGDKVSISMDQRLAEVTGVPDIDVRDFLFSLRLHDIDLDATKRYIALNQKLALASVESIEAMVREMESLAEQVLRGSPSIDIEQLRMTLNGEPLMAKAHIEIDGDALPPGVDLLPGYANPELLLAAMSADGRIEASETIAKMMATDIVRDQIIAGLPPEAQVTDAEIDELASQQSAAVIDALIEQGALQRAAGKLSVDFKFADSQLTVNGAPMPFGP